MADSKISALADGSPAVAGDLLVIARAGADKKLPVERLGAVLAAAKRTSNVATTGTTFATGADVLASALSFTADGSADYLAEILAPAWQNSTASIANHLDVNLDGGQYGFGVYWTNPAAGSAGQTYLRAGIVVPAPSAASHTLNLRLYCTGGTSTIFGNVGGNNQNSPIYVSLRRLLP